MAETDVLVHVHVPKTAGTAIRVWLFRAYPGGFGSWYPNEDFTEESLAAAGLGDLRLRALSTHNVRRFPARCCGRTLRYLTVVRDPIAQFLSWVYYRQQVQPDVRGLSSREFTARLLDRPEATPFREAPQTHFLAECAWRDAGGDPRDVAGYRAVRLALAKDALRGFTAVGTVERMRDSLEAMRRCSAAFGFALQPADAITHENVTTTARDDVSWIGPHDDVGARLLDALADDAALHRHAEALLNEALLARAGT